MLKKTRQQRYRFFVVLASLLVRFVRQSGFGLAGQTFLNTSSCSRGAPNSSVVAANEKRSGLFNGPKHCGIAVLFVTAMLVLPVVVAAEVVERILAVVNGKLVLLTDLERDRIFCPGPVSMAPLVESSADEPYPGLRALINKRLVLSEARRLNVSLLTDSIIEKSRKVLVDRFGGVKSLTLMMAAHGVDQTDLVRLLREHLLILRFLDVRVFPFIRTSRAVKDLSNGKLSSSIAQVRNARASERLENYLSRLRARATIEINPLL